MQSYLNLSSYVFSNQFDFNINSIKKEMTHLLDTFSIVYESLQIIGAFWYILAVERIDACWQKACSDREDCKRSLYCSKQTMGDQSWQTLLNSNCSDNSQFNYGIFTSALSNEVVSPMNFVSKYFYCLWWGLQNLRYVKCFFFTFRRCSINERRVVYFA